MPDAALSLYIYDSSVMAYSVTIQGSRIALRSRSRRPLLETLHGLIMSALKFFSIAQLLMWLSMSPCAAEDGRTVTRFLKAEVSISDGFKKCHSNQDCVLVHTGCDHCCQTQAINRSLVKEFEEKFLTACEGYSGRVCDCMALPSQAVCDNDRCEKKLKVATP
jgi:hypothetical protein